MDSVKIESRLLRGLVSRLLAHEIKKKTGYKIGINLGEFAMKSADDDRMTVHLVIDADMAKDELERILKDRML